MKNGGGGHFHDDDEFAEMLNQMFGAGAGGFSTGFSTASRSRTSKNAAKHFEVTLEDLYKGKQVKMMAKRKVVCSQCKGYHLSWDVC